MKDITYSQYSNDDEYEKAKRKHRKNQKSFRKLKAKSRSVDVKRLNESKCTLWKETFNNGGW